ncbi:MoxR-like ATPase [Paenibacillus sp. 1182]|uniref:AAA family ATPase n=1 Tax=Paenibacillus sp. 1182 TaxID=2806565 RepID=UPI001AE3532B|nr:AAA family ATPase [Paenibacillus sp. 1182]MBP1308661.1 MoxR-like ATPase [Paenibacillus sp. 1182]
MKNTTMVTVVGLSSRDPGKHKVVVGDVLFFEKELDNKDPYAIKAFTDKERESVGYVANGRSTVMMNTESAEHVYDSFEKYVWGQVVEITESLFKNGHKSKAFIVCLDIDDFVEGDVSMEQHVMKFKLVGAKTQYPKKFDVIDDLKKGKVPFIKIFPQDDKLVAEYEGGLAGYIDTKKQEGYSVYEDIVAAIPKEQIAKITGFLTTNLIGEFVLNAGELQTVKTAQDFKTVCQKVVEDGLATDEEIQKRIHYMEKCRVPEKAMIRVFESYQHYREEVATLIPEMKSPKVLYQDGDQGIVLDCISYINGDRNLLFEGDRGVGKNVLIETLAWLYRRPLYEFAINSQHDNSSLLGGKTIEADEDGHTKMGFDVEATIQAAVEGGVLNLDEINTGLAHALIIFNSLLDDRRRMYVPGYGNIQAHPNFIVIGSMNREYQGTFDLNEATADRFVPIVFPKMVSLKEVLLAKVPNVGLSIINKCDQLYSGIKKIVEDGEVSDKALTIRGFVDACIGVEQGLTLQRALITNVAHRCSDTDDRNAILNVIRASI